MNSYLWSREGTLLIHWVGNFPAIQCSIPVYVGDERNIFLAWHSAGVVEYMWTQSILSRLALSVVREIQGIFTRQVIGNVRFEDGAWLRAG